MGTFHANGGSAAPHAAAMVITCRGRVGSMGGEEPRKVAILSAVGVFAAVLLAQPASAGLSITNF